MEFDFQDNLSVPSDKFKTVVPADFQGLYVERDGKWALRTDDPTVGSAVTAIAGLNKSNRAMRAERDALKARVPDLSKLAEYGSDPDSILAGIEKKLDEVKATHSTKTGQELERQVAKIREDLGTAHRTELEKHVARINGLTSQLHNLLVTSDAMSALAEAGAVDPELVMPFIHSQVKVSEADGKFDVVVLQKNGDPRYSGATAKPMTIRELVGEMKADERYGQLFKSDAPRGGGANPPRRQGTGGDPAAPRTSLEKIQRGLEQRGARRK
jgi:hypothetical protein